MWAQLPDLCQGSSIKLLCIHITLRRVPGTNLWPPLFSSPLPVGAVPSSALQGKQAELWPGWHWMRVCSESLAHSCILSWHRWEECCHFPRAEISQQMFSSGQHGWLQFGKGQHSNAVHCWNSSDGILFGFSQASLQNAKQMPHRHSLKQEKISPDSP